MAGHPEHPPRPKDVERAEKELLARTPPVIAPGHTFTTITDTISHAVLEKKTPIGWFLGFGLAPSGF